MIKTRKLFLAFFVLISTSVFAQEQEVRTNKEGGGYHFTVVVDNEATPVQNQSRSGTCWSFSALSFMESELLRMGKGEQNLSEMYIVRKAYEDKAEKYVRMHGNMNFGAGGAFHDIPYVIDRYGIVPEEAYTGLNYGSETHNHYELDTVLTGMVNALKENPGKKLTPAWRNAVDGVLDAYLGEEPETFTYNGKEYTPQSYAETLGLDMDDYVTLSSFTHHPFYETFILEVPDNWVMGEVYNVKLDELIEAMDNALTEGYTLAWASDVSEKGFSFRDGLAIVPEDESTIITSGRDNRHFSDAGAAKISSAFDEPVQEKTITQGMRQEAFDNFETTDDHGMHITGIVNDQNGQKYYIVKNSWGTANDCDGYFYASEAFVRYKTMNVMLHKDALSKDLKKKLGIK